VQGEIHRAVRVVTGRKDFELYGSGRTDAGVHALAQVAHLDVSTGMPAESLRMRINDELPADINVLRVVAVPHRFHARHDAVARRYLYQIARRRTAFAKAYVWWVKESLDLTAMRNAARAFVGLRDFHALAAGGKDEPEETRGGQRLVLVELLEIVEDHDLTLVAIEGSHFLWKMVRRIVGVLVEVGRGGLPAAAVSSVLDESTTIAARLTAPPSGLFLERVYYAGEERERIVRAATPLRPAR
jgi:tRNA pseudouridine38-40 synthase